MRVQFERDSWIAVSWLRADGGDACAPVNQSSDPVPECMKSRESDPQGQKQRAQFLFP